MATRGKAITCFSFSNANVNYRAQNLSEGNFSKMGKKLVSVCSINM